MTNIRNALMQAAGTAASGDPVYVEDVFSTHLYTGTGSNLTINNGLDLSGEGGLVWVKSRATRSHAFYDTVRGTNSLIASNNTNGAATVGQYITYNNNGFTLTSQNNDQYSGEEYCSWSWRKKEGHFTVLQYSGTGSSQNISHDLGSVPGMIIVKMISSDGYKWRVWHKSLGNSKALCLNDDSAESDDGGGGGGWWNNTAPTSSVFSVGDYGQTNNNGSTFIAYLFGEEASFGDDSDEAIVKCGSYTADSSNAYAVNLGFEPQWLMIKRSSGTGDWEILDNMRGVSTYDPALGQFLEANKDPAEFNDYGAHITSTGFVGSNQSGANGASYVYIAIRRGPMKEPTAGTDLLDIETYTGNGNSTREFSFDITPDFIYQRSLGGATYNFPALHFRIGKATSTSSNSVFTSSLKFDRTKGAHMTSFENTVNQNSESYIMYAFKRFPKAIEVLTYESFDETSLSSFNQPHNLGVQPELMMFAPYYVAQGSTSVNGAFKMWWQLNPDNVYNTFTSGTNTSASWLADPTADHIVLSTNNNMSFYDVPGPNVKGFMVILFASVEGIIKIGEYSHGSGNSSTVSVTTGFQPRFILLQHDDGGAWTQFDTVRGISSSNDSHFEWASTSAQTTSVDVFQSISSTGFVIESPNGGNSASFNHAGSGRKSRYIAIA